MIFIRESSRDSIAFRLVQFGMSRSGVQVTVGMVDQQGCAREGEGWNSLYTKSSLGDVIAGATDVPQDEAEELAGSVLRQWEERAGDREDVTRRQLVTALAGVVGFSGLLLVAAGAVIVLIVWLLTQLL